MTRDSSDSAGVTRKSRAKATDAVKRRRKKRRPRLPAEERREQIIAAAQTVFIRSGLNGSRTKELAEAAGVNEATLFAHFPTKEDLFDAAIVEPLEQAMRANIELAHTYTTIVGVEEQARLHKEAHKRFLAAIYRIYPLMMTALYSDSERGRAFYNKHIYPWFQALNETQRKTFGGHPRKNITPETVSMVGVGAYLTIVMDRHFRGVELDVDLAVEEVSEILNSGLFEP
ncbi:MAG: TetR/AcrR family transcriptional regulator [Sphingomonadales bacterium]